MFLVALLLVAVLWLLLTNWQLTLLGVGVWMLVRALAARYPGPRAVDGGLPAAAYLPRWTAMRRRDARREHAQWQEWFDASR